MESSSIDVKTTICSLSARRNFSLLIIKKNTGSNACGVERLGPSSKRSMEELQGITS